MKNRDIDVTTTSSAKDALGLVASGSYDAIILDLQMPEMDGLQTLEKLKAINPDLQVILLTGHATVEKGVQAMKLGASDVMEKPADIQSADRKNQKGACQEDHPGGEGNTRPRSARYSEPRPGNRCRWRSTGFSISIRRGDSRTGKQRNRL